jgi:hypothetical protein
MMNTHVLVDKLTVNSAAAAVKDFRFFGDGLESADLAEHIEAVKLKAPALNGEGRYELEAESLVGTLDPAFMVARWLGAGYPTILHHHGNNERPFDMGMASKNSFKNIFLASKPPFPANLIALRAPYHTDLRIYMKEVRRLDHFAAMLAVSVRLVEELVQAVRAKTGSEVIVTGISLGGWVANCTRPILTAPTSMCRCWRGRRWMRCSQARCTASWRARTCSRTPRRWGGCSISSRILRALI